MFAPEEIGSVKKKYSDLQTFIEARGMSAGLNRTKVEHGAEKVRSTLARLLRGSTMPDFLSVNVCYNVHAYGLAITYLACGSLAMRNTDANIPARHTKKRMIAKALPRSMAPMPQTMTKSKAMAKM